MDFFDQVGKIAIGSRLRMLTEKIMEDAAKIYRLYDIDLQPKWFPVFYTLSQCDGETITAIAKRIGHSHPSVSKIISEMAGAGFVSETKDSKDGRKNVVQLSEKGRVVSEKIKLQYEDVNRAIEEIQSQANADLWKAMEEWEFILNRKPLFKRVQEQKKNRESREVEIVAYATKYQAVFKALNKEWITRYFKMEEADHKALDNPKGYILNKGGHILVALYQKEPVGVCALLKMDNGVHDFELAKMAVAPEAQGKNIGWLLGMAVIEKARSLGARKLYLESNTKLNPAISLYHKLGFKKVAGYESPYERCNIQMELDLPV